MYQIVDKKDKPYLNFTFQQQAEDMLYELKTHFPNRYKGWKVRPEREKKK